MLSGFYYGLDKADLAKAEKWLGGTPGIVATNTGRENWTDWSGSIAWQIIQVKNLDTTSRWSIPMFANGGTLADAAAHKYDSYYVTAAKQLAAAYAGKDQIIVRVGEEFNADWMPWAAQGKEANYVKAYQNFVDAFRSVSDKFKFEWNVNVGGTMDPAKAYPGDKYVDFVGMDFYWDSKWGITDPVKAFNYYKDQPYGLQWLESFAASHGKQSAYSEWGVSSANASQYVQLVKQWFDSHNVAYEMYWDADDFKQSDKAGTATSDAFKTSFSLSNLVLDTKASVGTLGNSVMDNLIGNDLANTLTGNGGSNVVKGLGGNDVLDGGGGNDTLTGGSGSDVFRFAVGGGKDVVTDFGANGDGDLIDISAYLAAKQKPVLADVGNDVVLTFASGDTITLEGVHADGLVATATGYKAGPGFLSQVGTDQKATTTAMWTHTWDKLGTAGDKDCFTIDLKSGYDMRFALEAGGSGMGTLADGKLSLYDPNGRLVASDDNSGSGADAALRYKVVTGGTYYLVVESADGGTGSYMLDSENGTMLFSDGGKLAGTAAADILVGSRLADTLSGGAGGDRFQMGLGGGKDTIADFGAGDVIDLMAFTQAGYKPTLVRQGGDTLISFGSGDSIKVLGTTPDHLKANYWGYTYG